MEIPVLVEQLATQGFRASTGEPFPLDARGDTPEQAMQMLHDALTRHLQGGKQLMALKVDVAANPWLDPIGAIDPNDPLTKVWESEMAAHRLEFENDPNRP